MFVDYIVLPQGDKWLLKKIIVIESFIQEIRSKTLIHSVMEQVKYLWVSLNHSFALFNNSVKLLLIIEWDNSYLVTTFSKLNVILHSSKSWENRDLGLKQNQIVILNFSRILQI